MFFMFYERSELDENKKSNFITCADHALFLYIPVFS